MRLAPGAARPQPAEHSKRIRGTLGVGLGPGALDRDMTASGSLFLQSLDKSAQRALFSQLLGEPHRVVARWQVHADLKFGTATRRLFALMRDQHIVLGQLSGVMLGQRPVRALLFLRRGMPVAQVDLDGPSMLPRVVLNDISNPFGLLAGARIVRRPEPLPH